MTGKRLTHECAAMRGDVGEDTWASLYAVVLVSEGRSPRWSLRWSLRLNDRYTDESTAAFVKYCPWCGKRLDGQREEGC